MDVIPVIDVRQGIAVRAIRGCRADYQPLKTSLSESNKPEAVALGFRSLYPFPILYLADLDGIEGRGRDVASPKRLVEVLPDIDLWIDDGSTPRDLAARMGNVTNTTIVIGSESLVDEETVALQSMDADSYVLSLDFKDDHFLGPASVLEDAEHWPERVIVMTLARSVAMRVQISIVSQSLLHAQVAGASMPLVACVTVPMWTGCVRRAPPVCSSRRRCIQEK